MSATMEIINNKIPPTSIRSRLNFPRPILGRMVIAKTMDKRINGKFTIKIAGQSHESMMKPPIEGPNAADVVEKIDRVDNALACPSVILVRTILIPLGNRAELPIACNARQLNKKAKFVENGANPQATATSKSPVKNTFFGPNISLNLPITGCPTALAK